jgi:predicted AlkP superfamily pyrophosphatase or phosphodiesterase
MELVFPDYEGSSIANFSAGLLERFMARLPEGSVPYSFESNGIDLKGSEKVVVFVIDALGYFNLLRVMEENSFRLFSREDIRILTSVFPSTTTAALTSIFTATPPSGHGFLGYLLNIPEYGGLVNMIELTPYTQDRDNLTRLGFDPLKYIERQTIFESLKEAGVRGYHLTSKSFVNTGLTRMHTRGGIARGAHGIGDILEELKLVLDSEEASSLTIVYWGLIDTYGHRYGPQSLAYSVETTALIRSIEDFFDRYVTPGTSFFITADHGQIQTPWDREIWWSKFDRPFEHMYSMPGGEQRMAYIYTSDREKTREVLEELYGDSLLVIPTDSLDWKKYFGGEMSNTLKKRVGELITISKEDYSFCFKYTGQEHSLKGRHGGLSPEEMYVPLIFLRKD